MELSKTPQAPRRASHYSSVYVEEAALSFPRTQAILQNFTKSSVIPIRHYKDVFNRKGQRWREQKKSQALILAVRRDQFLYSGSSFTPSFGHQNFYYNTLVMNCLYDCDYCYLQGMYPSASTVVFVNLDDYFSATDLKLRENSALYLSISYDTDLLGFEGLLSYCAEWIDFASTRPNLLVEIRTKSANFSMIEELPPLPNIILAWTLSPQEVIERYEPRTPPLSQRVKSLSRALSKGWNVRLCIDPLLAIDNWEIAYRGLLEEVSTVEGAFYDISLGVFRMNHRYLMNIQKQRSDSEILFSPFERSGDELSYPDAVKEKLLSHIETAAREIFPSTRIAVQR